MPKGKNVSASVFEHQHRIWPGWSEDLTRLDAAADMIESLSPSKHGIQFIDLGCGSGQLSNVLAKRRYNVTGVDISAKLICKAVGLSHKMGVSENVTFIVDDYFSYTPPRLQDVIVFWDSSINLYPLADIRKLLLHWRGQLAPQGHLIVEMLNPQNWEDGTSELNIPPSDWSPGYTRRVYNFDKANNVLTDKISYKSSEDGKFTSLPAQVLHLYPPCKFVGLLREIGAKSVSVLTSNNNNFSEAEIHHLKLDGADYTDSDVLSPSDKSPSLCYIFKFK